MNTVLTVAGVYHGNETASWTEDREAKVQELLLNMDKFGVVEVVDRPSPQSVLSNRWLQKQRLDGSYKMRVVARGFGQTVRPKVDFNAGAPKLTTLRGLLNVVAIHRNPAVAFGDCYNAFHQPPMLSDLEPVYAEQALEAKVDPSRVWLCRTAFQGPKISSQASTRNINDMGFDQLVSDPSAYVAKRAKRHLDSILERWMTRSAPHQRSISCVTLGSLQYACEDCGGVAQPRRYSELRGLGISKTGRGFEERNSTELVDSLLSFFSAGELETSRHSRTALQRWSSRLPLRSKENDSSTFRTAVGKLIFMAPWRADIAFRHPKVVHTSAQSYNREQTRSETVASMSQEHTKTLVFVWSHTCHCKKE